MIPIDILINVNQFEDNSIRINRHGTYKIVYVGKKNGIVSIGIFPISSDDGTHYHIPEDEKDILGKALYINCIDGTKISDGESLESNWWISILGY